MFEVYALLQLKRQKCCIVVVSDKIKFSDVTHVFSVYSSCVIYLVWGRTSLCKYSTRHLCKINTGWPIKNSSVLWCINLKTPWTGIILFSKEHINGFDHFNFNSTQFSAVLNLIFFMERAILWYMKQYIVFKFLLQVPENLNKFYLSVT